MFSRSRTFINAAVSLKRAIFQSCASTGRRHALSYTKKQAPTAAAHVLISSSKVSAFMLTCMYFCTCRQLLQPSAYLTRGLEQLWNSEQIFKPKFSIQVKLTRSSMWHERMTSVKRQFSLSPYVALLFLNIFLSWIFEISTANAICKQTKHEVQSFLRTSVICKPTEHVVQSF